MPGQALLLQQKELQGKPEESSKGKFSSKFKLR
jgi:hypothetical protein